MRDRLSTRTSVGGGTSTPQGVSPRITPSVTRKSLAAGDVDIAAIYTEAIKLSATNKINTKNAFNLSLIDYMNHLIKQKPDEKVNFKLVSSALDAGSKIYGSRVDCVHAEAQKVASGLVIVLDKDKDGDRAGRSAGDEDGDMESDEAGEGNGNRPKKRKTHRKTVKTIANNLDTISTKSVECNPPPDPLFSLLSSSFDIGNVTGLLVPNLNHEDETGLLLLTQAEYNLDQDYLDVKDDTLILNHLQTIADSRAQIVPSLARFEFLSRDSDQNASMSTLRATVESRMTVFDESPNDDLEIDTANSGDFCDDPAMSDNASSIGDPQELTAVEVDRGEALIKLDDDNATDILLKIFTNDEMSEYKTPLDGMWAGPEFTKFSRPTQKKSQLNPDGTKSVRKPKAQYKEIDFSQPIPEDDDPKAETQLKVTTLTKWTERLLPDDISYDPVNLLKPFLKESATFRSLKVLRPDPNKVSKDSRSISDDGRNSPMDDGMDVGGHYDDDYPSETQFPNPGFTQDIGVGDISFNGNNLIDEPFLVSQTNLPFSTVAKKIDVKKLKREMWCMLAPDEHFSKENTPEPNEHSEIGASSGASPSKILPFSDMYKKLPDKVGSSMANNLSVPIAFVALLHLTNEKDLELEGKPDLSDFIIKPPPAS